MKYLVAFLLSVGVATAADFGTSHDIVLFGEQSIAAGETNTIETTYKVRGLFRQLAIWQNGSGVTTTTAYSVRSGKLFTLAIKAGDDGATKGTPSGATIEHGLYDETIRLVTVNYGTNTITVIPAIIYEK